MESLTRAPKVSVIIPTWNASAHVTEALQSVAAQRYPNVEIIVVDDGSSDDTIARVEAFGHSVTLVRQVNAGAAAARNRGMEIATGDYLAFLDADDVWLPDKLARQVQHLEAHPNVGAVYGHWIAGDCLTDVITDNTSVAQVAVDIPQSGWIYHVLLIEPVIQTSSILVRTAVARTVGTFDTTLRNGQDYDYWLRLSRQTRIDKLQAPVSLYRLHPGNNTKVPKPINYEYVIVRRAIERWGLTSPNGMAAPPPAVASHLSDTCTRFAYTHFWRGDVRLAREYFLHALRYRALRPKVWCYAVASLMTPARFSKMRCSS